MNDLIEKQKRTSGERLRDIRKQLSLSQKELAEKLGVNTSTVSKYEAGALPIDVEKAVVIASLIKKPISYVLGLDVVEVYDPEAIEVHELMKEIKRMVSYIETHNTDNKAILDHLRGAVASLYKIQTS